MPTDEFVNATDEGEIPSFNGDEKAKASDFANYFCSYAQLYHQKQMLADHNRMAAYHSAIMGNPNVFKDKVVMDVGTGSGILAVWCAQAGARKVYAGKQREIERTACVDGLVYIDLNLSLSCCWFQWFGGVVEYTDMAKHARSVVEANGVENVVTVIQGAVEDIVLPTEADGLEVADPERDAPTQVVDIMVSEWMGYFLLRESMLDSLVRARDKFLKPRVGLMFPSHTTMYLAPVVDEEERKMTAQEHSNSMSDWYEFASSTKAVYGVDMSILESEFEREQREYYLLSSRWSELAPEAVLAEPKMVKHLDMCTCTIDDSRGIPLGAPHAGFDFEIDGTEVAGPVSGFAGWFTADFKSRTDPEGAEQAPRLLHPAFLSTGPENGYTHWGQQTFYFPSSIPLMRGQTTRLAGQLEMMRTKQNARLYNCRITYISSRRSNDVGQDGPVLHKSEPIEHVYHIP